MEKRIQEFQKVYYSWSFHWIPYLLIFSTKTTCMRNSFPGQSVVFGAGEEDWKGRGRRDERAHWISMELLETTGEEEMAPWLKGRRHHRT